MVQTAYIVYSKIMQDKPGKVKELTVDELEEKKRVREAKDWNNFSGYNEEVAMWGYINE